MSFPHITDLLRLSGLLALLLLTEPAFGQGRKAAKKDIRSFEQTAFAFPLDSALDSTAVYHSVFRFTHVENHGGPGFLGINRTKRYQAWTNQTLTGRELIKRTKKPKPRQVVVLTFRDSLLSNKGTLYDAIINRQFVGFGRLLLSFDHTYLMIVHHSLISTTDSRQTGPILEVLTYEYYRRQTTEPKTE